MNNGTIRVDATPQKLAPGTYTAQIVIDAGQAGSRIVPVTLVVNALPPQQPMLAQSTVSAVESAFNSLAHTVLSSNARTLEDLVKEMLRPMLKSWLDDNLPGLVERIVKAEIERVSRGGR